jgi:protein gp37
MGETSIQWTDKTWNPVTGCTKVSAGCKHCYAERVFPRPYGGICKCGHIEAAHDYNDMSVGLGIPATCFHESCSCAKFQQRQFTDVLTHADRLDQPLHWRKPQRIFVNSMSDLFHEDVPEHFIDQVFAVMALCPQHTFQILTKRPERMWEYLSDVGLGLRIGAHLMDSARGHVGAETATIDIAHELTFGGLPNVWLGVSVEDQKTADARIPKLLETPAAVRFVSYEPALGPVDFTDISVQVGTINALNGRYRDEEGFCGCFIDWVIIGGESGPGARPFDLQWARDVIRQCKAAGTAVFVKQLGADAYDSTVDQPCIDGSVRFGMPLDPERQKRGAALLTKDRKGGDMEEWPSDLRIREFPSVEVVA